MTVLTEVGGVAVSAATISRLQVHLDQLLRWNTAINLVAKSTLGDAWRRHVEDSAQLMTLAPPAAGLWVDLGSGAGFPGLVVAAILAEVSPESRVVLVEADRRKATFLRETARVMEVSVDVRAERIETIAPLNADVVSARALASLDRLLPLAAPHLSKKGTALFQKGARVDAELAVARKTWSFSLECRRSLTDPDAEILRIRDLNHV